MKIIVFAIFRVCVENKLYYIFRNENFLKVLITKNLQ